MSRTRKRNDKGQYAINKALKEDNKRVRHKQNEHTRKLKDNPDLFDEEAEPIRREISNPWDYD